MEPYSRHVLVCTGGFCSPDRRGRELYALLPELLQREQLLFGPRRVKRGETPCLGVCAGGPIVVVYPDGTGPFAGRFLTWNAGACCGIAASALADDVGFVRALLDDHRYRDAARGHQASIEALASPDEVVPILTAVARKHLQQAYALSDPSLRSGVTTKEWRQGSLPVVYSTVGQILKTNWKNTNYAHPRDAQINVIIIPDKGKPWNAQVGLTKVGHGANAHWLVNYFQPLGGVPVPTPK